MTPEQFIEKAIEGGWKAEQNPFVTELGGSPNVIHRADIFLDPKAWQAVGKVEGWDKTQCLHCNQIVSPGSETLSMNVDCNHEEIKDCGKKWLKNMHRMIDALAEGKTIEEFLLSI